MRPTRCSRPWSTNGRRPGRSGTPGLVRTDRRNLRRGSRRNDKMQLGVVGLGRMGGNIVRRLMRHGHACVVYDAKPEAVAAAGRRGRDRRRAAWPIWWPSSQAPRAVWVMLPAGADHRADGARRCAALLERRRHRDRRRQHLLPGRHPPRQGAGAKGIRLCRRRHLGRRLGPGARLLHDGRRRPRRRSSGSTRSSRRWRPGCGTIPRTTGREGARPARRAAATSTPGPAAPGISSR